MSGSWENEDILVSSHFDETPRPNRRLLTALLIVAAAVTLGIVQPWRTDQPPPDPLPDGSGTYTRVQDVQFLDGLVGYAAVTSCPADQSGPCWTDLAVTADSGLSWEQRSPLPTRGIVHDPAAPTRYTVRLVAVAAESVVAMVTAERARLPTLGVDAALVRSQDGGRTWSSPQWITRGGRVEPAPADAALYAIPAPDCDATARPCARTVGWLDITTAELVTLPIPATYLPTADPAIGRGASDGGREIYVAAPTASEPLRLVVLSSMDSGLTWNRLDIDTGTSGLSDYTITVASPGHDRAYLGVLSPGDGAEPVLYELSNAGQRAVPVGVRAGHPDFTQLFAVWPGLVSLSSRDGDLWTSTDNGSTWSATWGLQVSRVIITCAGAVWVGVRNGVPATDAVVLSTDAGRTWRQVTLP